jgi:hypothetical protein
MAEGAAPFVSGKRTSASMMTSGVLPLNEEPSDEASSSIVSREAGTAMPFVGLFWWRIDNGSNHTDGSLFQGSGSGLALPVLR